MDLAGIGSALKGMFRLRPNSKSHKEMLRNLDELRSVAAEVQDRPADTVSEAIEMMLGGRNA